MPLTEKSKYFMPIPDKQMHEPLSSEKLENMSVLAKKQLLIDLDQHQNHLELKRENALEVEKRGGKIAEQGWLTRINYRIGVAKRQKKIIEKYLNAERAERFETRNPNDLIRPEYVQSGLLETPRLDDGLSDPLPREQIAAETKKKALESTTGQNEQRLRDKGLGWLLKGYSATGRETNMTANKNATIQTKSAIMQEKRRTTETTNTTGKKSSY